MSRDRLLDSARQLFLEYSYGNLTMETIAKDAHVSLRTIYSQFGGKAGLFGAVIRRYSDQFVGTLARDKPLEEALLTFARQFLQSMTLPEIIRIRAILIAESPRFPELALQFYEQGPRRTLNYLAEFFKFQQAAGRIAPFDAEFLAEQYLSLLRGEQYYRLQLGLELPPCDAKICDLAEQATQLFLHGCLLATPTDKTAP
ncbi:TetR/AcrR family transcriptional regulator [Methylomonas paludis]|uniref:TetR/AcrR family transcriptional regulator n=1 Tax=Methylomonas paludis TaxID=1173101 RepID=UPI0031BA37AB